jgi:hypothetical protein
MNVAHEKKLLRGMLKHCDRDAFHKPKPLWLLEVLTWLLITAAFLLLYWLFGMPNWSQVRLISTSFVVGAGVMFFLLRQVALTKWPVIVRFIDRPKLQERLRELGA